MVPLAVFGGLYALSPSDRVAKITVPLGASVVAAGLYSLAARRWSTVAVLRVALVVDTLLIATMTAALERPDVLAIAYFWAPALPAFLLGSRKTALNTLVAAACAAVVSYLTPL